MRREGSGRGDRGQLSLSLVEAGVGVLLVFGVVAGFLLAPATPDADAARLDRHAEDAAAVLAAGGGAVPPIGATVRSAESFERARPALDRRLDRLLPATVLYRVGTPRGSFGHPVPEDARTGVARLPTGRGDVVVRVWYA